MKKKSIFSKLFFLMMMGVIAIALYGCGKKDPKESYKAASLATEKKLREESDKIVSENPVLKKMDEISKNGTALSMSMESSTDPTINTIAVGMKDDPKAKVMSMTLSANGSTGSVYLDDNNITLEVLGQKLLMPAEGFAEKLKKWLVDNALIQYAPGLEAGDFTALNFGYSDLLAMRQIQTNVFNNYLGTFRALEDVAKYTAGADEDLALNEGTVKAQTVTLTLSNEDYKAWVDKLIEQVKADKDLKQWSEFQAFFAALGQQPNIYDIDTMVAGLEKARDFDASSFSVKAYIVKDTVQKYVIILDKPDVEKDKIEISVAFLGSKNLMDKIEMQASSEDGKKASITGEGNLIPKDNVMAYTFSVNPVEGQGTPVKLDFNWNIAKTDADNITIKMDAIEKTGFFGLDDKKNVNIYFSPTPGIEKVSITMEPLTDTITVPTEAKNIFDMTKTELIDLVLGK